MITKFIKNYLRWWTHWKRVPVLDWIKAAELYKAGRFAAAETLYRRGIQHHPSHPARYSAQLDLAYCLFKERRLKEAESTLRIVANSCPTPREAFLRLARLQLWEGLPLEAAWTMKRAHSRIGVDGELVATYLLAITENDGPDYLLKEALAYYDALQPHEKGMPLLQVARAMLKLRCGEYQKGKDELRKICFSPQAPFEAFVAYVSYLLRDEGATDECRAILKKALTAAPDYPRVLSLFAEFYLKSGSHYNPQYAVQMATLACQNTDWNSPREMHILAEAYYHSSDRVSALVIANKAKNVGTRTLATYKDAKNLERLIESLCADQ